MFTYVHLQTWDKNPHFFGLLRSKIKYFQIRHLLNCRHCKSIQCQSPFYLSIYIVIYYNIPRKKRTGLLIQICLTNVQKFLSRWVSLRILSLCWLLNLTIKMLGCFFLEQKLKTTHSSDNVELCEMKRMNVHTIQIPSEWEQTFRSGSIRDLKQVPLIMDKKSRFPSSLG